MTGLGRRNEENEIEREVEVKGGQGGGGVIIGTLPMEYL